MVHTSLCLCVSSPVLMVKKKWYCAKMTRTNQKKERNGIDHVAANKEKGKYDHTGRRK
jgi:hypothetical protein